MKLICAEILHTLKHKPILMATAPNGEPQLFEAKDKRRAKLLNPLFSKIHNSQKFIFDSGSDKDERTVNAVRETTVNMIEAGLFHQPFPIMWIEDPYDDNPDGSRYIYLAIEEPKQITIWFFTKMDLSSFEATKNAKIPNICFHPFPLLIDLTEPSDTFTVPTAEMSPLYGSILGEAVYSYKKLMVTLNTADLAVEKVNAKASKSWSGNPITRPYDHRIVRVPLDFNTEGGTETGGDGRPRRRHLVRGYVWGRLTRPIEEQRWIKPFWRGEHDVEIKERHYVVG